MRAPALLGVPAALPSVLAGALLWVACGGGEEARADGGLPDSAVMLADSGPMLAPLEPTPPREVVPPTLTPCPSGWWERTDARGVAYCEPWPEDGPSPGCALDEAHFAGGEGCERVGTACPSGDYPEGLPAGADVVYVLAGASPDGDGTESAPYATIADALSSAPAGAIIALGKGTHAEDVVLSGDHTLWGACPAETAIVGSNSPGAQVVMVQPGADAALRNLSVRAAATRGVGAASTLALEDVVVDGVARAGVNVASGGVVSARRLVVRNTRALPVVADASGAFGAGIQIEPGGAATVSEAVLEKNVGLGVAALGGEVTLVDVAIRETLCGIHGGGGVYSQASGRVTGSDVSIEGSCAGGVVATDASTVSLDGFVVRDSRPLAGGVGVGVTTPAVAGSAPTIELSRGTVSRSNVAGILVDAGRITANDVRITDVGTDSAGQFGVPVLVNPEVSFVGRRLSLSRGHGAGVGIHDADAVLEDVAIFGIEPSRTVDPATGSLVSSLLGAGIAALGETTSLSVSGVRIERVGVAGIVVNRGASFTAEDVSITEVVGRPDGTSGVGLAVEGRSAWFDGAATAVVRRIEVTRHREVGLSVSGAGGVLVASDVIVRDGVGREATGEFGYGAGAQFGGRLDLERALFENNRSVGVAVQYGGASARLTDLVVRGTRARSDGRFGRGLHVMGEDGAVAPCPPPGAVLVEVDRARLEGNREMSLLSACGAQVALAHVSVSDTLERSCTLADCPEGPGGHGVAIFGAGLSATETRVERAALCGIVVGVDDVDVRFESTTVHESAIGFCHQTAQPLESLVEGIRFDGNGVRVQTTGFAEPALSLPPTSTL